MTPQEQTSDAARGREARLPHHVPIRGWLDIAARILARFGTVHVALVSAGIAFYALLALFPAITAAVAIVGLVYDPVVLVDQAGWLLIALPEAARTLIGDQLRAVSGSPPDALGLAVILSTAIALWSASAAIGSMVQALNLIYEETESRGFLRLKFWTIFLTLVALVVLALSIVIVAAIPAMLIFIGVHPSVSQAALWLRWPLMFMIGVFGIAALYRWAPCRRPARWHWLTPGAVTACALWVLVTLGFSLYVQSFASYNETFGALAGVIILLTWLWLSALVVLLGALLDAEMEAQTARDSTIGPDRPRGERGAVKADILGKTRDEMKKEAQNPPD